MSDAEGYQAIAEAEVEAASHRPPERTLGQKLRVPLMAAGVAVVLGVVAYSLLTGGRFESTDDAYVQTARTAISASIDGRVIEVDVKENQQVRKGQVLFRLDPADHQVAIAQAEAALAAAEAQQSGQAATTGKLDVVAPRAGRVDSLPYRLGDEAPIGAPLAVMLVGDAPHARIYVPEPLRPQVQVGDAATVRVGANGERSYRGRVRMIRSEPTFTPYYALSGKDAARLSYLAEVQLEGEGVAELPAGLPLRVEFGHGD